MRIAVITSSYPRFLGDGTAPFVKSICDSLVSLGHHIEVIAPYDPLVSPMENDDITQHRFRYIWPEKLNIMGHARALNADVKLRPLAIILLPLFLFAAFIKLMRITRHQNTQIIHSHWVIPNGLVAAWVAAIRDIPFIISLHGSDIYLARRNRLFGAVARWIFSRASTVTACSPDLKQGATDLGASDKTVLLPWGADPDIFHPVCEKDQRYAFAFRKSPDFSIVALGRLVPKKGFNILLAAYSQLVIRYPNSILTIGGDGPLKKELITQSENLGLTENVIFAGHIPWNDVPELLGNADIFVMPSIRDKYGNVDGLPTVLPEAMACGNAIVASDIGGVNLIIEDDHNGLLVPPGNFEALYEALLLLVRDSKKRGDLSNAARNSITKQFNWKNVALHFVNIYNSAIWHHAQTPRLGTLYRTEILRMLQKCPKNGRVLDIGCYDGYWLTKLNAKIRIGVDTEPIGGAPGVDFVRADGCYLPFCEGAFTNVFAMDVIEHIEDDRSFAKSLIHVVAPGGKIFMTTPSKNIRLFPAFLTRWISNKWGHNLRLGYSPKELKNLFVNSIELHISPWNAPIYRWLYIPLRLLSMAAPKLAGKFVIRAAHFDLKYTHGDRGFLLLVGRKATKLKTEANDNHELN